MKRIWRSFLRPVKSQNYQQKAIEYAEEMEKTGTIHRAPRHPTDQKYFQKAQADERISEEIRKRNDVLIDNMNKISVISSGPKDRWTPTKDLQSKDTEWVHRNDQIWEFGFYEPAPEKIPKGKLMFREALEANPSRTVRQRFCIKAMQRIDEEALGTIWKYFRPFERKEQQYTVSRKDVDELCNEMLGFHKEPKIPTLEDIRKKKNQELEEELHTRLEGNASEEEKEELERFMKAKELKAKEDIRLSQELKKLGLMSGNEEVKTVKDDIEKRCSKQAK
uniref:Uncharacterized protein n=1 Tax=Setaria digitata TaxID=48799 RepID=A0A915PJH9_9BILA